MRSFTDTALLEISNAGEADRVEFKEAVSDGAGIRQAICAFANDLPDRAAAYYERGHAKSQLEEYVSALAAYDRAIAIKPYDAAAYYNRGNVKQQLGHNAEALADFKHALTLAQQQGDQKVAQHAEAKIKELESAQGG